MQVTLDLLHEFTNTRIFVLFHNCMWQSRYSEIDVHLLELCEQTSWLSTHNGWPRSVSIVALVLLVVEQLLDPILSSNHVSKKSLEEAKVTHILSRI